MVSLTQELAGEATAAAAPIRARHLAERLPTWPYGTLTTLASLDATQADVLDACTLLVTLRHYLNWIEFRHLRRASRAHYVLDTSQHSLVGDLLGISKSGITHRRRRLARIAVERGQVKNAPSLPRIDPPAAVDAAELLVEHRDGRGPVPTPPPEDLVGVAAHAARWPDQPDLDQLAADIRAAITVVVYLRRRFDDIEADLLDAGRELGIPHADLGRPFGRLHRQATWRAWARNRTGDRAGRRRRPHAPEVDQPVIIAETIALETPVAVQAQDLIARLLAYRPKIQDPDLDIWLEWLADHATTTPTDRTLSLLGAAADDIRHDPHSQTIDGLVALAIEITAFRRAHPTLSA